MIQYGHNAKNRHKEIKMKRKLLITGGLMASLASCATNSSTTSSAEAVAEVSVVKCLGIAKAGKNDCGSTDGRHKCSGKSSVDFDPTEWVYIPDGTLCEKLGGTKMIKEGKVVKKLKPKSKIFGS